MERTDMDVFSEEFNELLVDAYRSLTEIEEQMVRSTSSLDLSINEIHLIDAVGRNRSSSPPGRTISDLSESVGLSLPSVTIAVNKLVRKGYVEKRRSPLDGRVVLVTLTRRGEKVDRAHRYFHQKMIAAVMNEMTEEEKRVMAKGIIKLNDFFNKKLARTDENE